MTKTKSFKELMEKVKERHPELKESLEEMEDVITDKALEALCTLCSKNKEGE